MLFNIGLGLILVVYFKLGAFGRLFPPMLFQSFILCVFIIIFVKKFHVDHVLLKNALIFCTPLILVALLNFPIQFVDKILLERLHNNTEFAFYNIGENIAGYVALFAVSILQTFEPDIFTFVSLKKKLSLITIFIAFAGVLFIAAYLFSIVSTPIVHYLTAGRYMGATKYVNLMVVCRCLEQIVYFLGFTLIALKLTKLSLINKILLSILSIGLLLHFIPIYEYIGAVYIKIFIYLIWILLLILEIANRKNRLLKPFYVRT